MAAPRDVQAKMVTLGGKQSMPETTILHFDLSHLTPGQQYTLRAGSSSYDLKQDPARWQHRLMKVTTWSLQMLRPGPQRPRPLPDGIRLDQATGISPAHGRVLYGLI